MKKPIILILVISMVFCMAACSKKADDTTNSSTNESHTSNNSATTVADTKPDDTTNDSTESTNSASNSPLIPTVPPLRKQSLLGSSTPAGTFEAALECFGTPWNSDVGLDIPIYSAVDLFYLYNSNMHQLTYDSSYGIGEIPAPFNSAAVHIMHFPTKAIRMREDGTSYTIYDSDTGYRLYILLGTPAEYPYLTGYPIVVNKSKGLLSRCDFDAIQIGDPMEKVEAIDKVATLHREAIHYTYLNPFDFELRAKEGNPIVSVHYLKDGLLIIEYTMVEAPNIIVSKISFYEDYVVPTADGKMTSHKIKDIDLPQL